MTMAMKTPIWATMDLGHDGPQPWATTDYDYGHEDTDLSHHGL